MVAAYILSVLPGFKVDLFLREVTSGGSAIFSDQILSRGLIPTVGTYHRGGCVGILPQKILNSQKHSNAIFHHQKCYHYNTCSSKNRQKHDKNLMLPLSHQKKAIRRG